MPEPTRWHLVVEGDVILEVDGSRADAEGEAQRYLRLRTRDELDDIHDHGGLTVVPVSDDPTRPVAIFTPCVRVRVMIEQPDVPRLHMDDGTCRALQQWMLDERIFALQGTSASGPGRLIGDSTRRMLTGYAAGATPKAWPWWPAMTSWRRRQVDWVPPAWLRRRLYDVAASRARVGNGWDRVVRWLERVAPVSAQRGRCCHCRHRMANHTDSGMCLVNISGGLGRTLICPCLDGGTKP